MNEDYFQSLWDSTPSTEHTTTCVESEIQFKDITVQKKKYRKGTSIWVRYFYNGHPDFINKSGGFTSLITLYLRVQQFYKEAVRRENYKRYLQMQSRS